MLAYRPASFVGSRRTEAPWAWQNLRSGGVIHPNGVAVDLVRGLLGVRDSLVTGSVNREGYGSEHYQATGSVGQRIDLGAFPHFAEVTAMVRFIARTSTGNSSGYGHLICRGDGTFGTDTTFAIGFRGISPYGSGWFMYNRNAGSVDGTEGAGTGVPVLDVTYTLWVRWKAGAQNLWLQRPTGWGQLLSNGGGVGSAGTDKHLWLAGAGDMAANADQASPPATILAWGVWDRYLPEAFMRSVSVDPIAIYRRRSRLWGYVAAAGGGDITGAGAVTLPALAAAGAGDVDVVGAGAVTLSALTAIGVGVVDIVGAAAVTLPSLGSSGAGVVAVQGSGAVTLPMLIAAGSDLGTRVGTADVTLPILSASGAGLAYVGGLAAVNLPALTGSGVGVLQIAGQGVATIPLLVVSGAGGLLIVGAGAATLPMLVAFAYELALLPLQAAEIEVSLARRAELETSLARRIELSTTV